MPTKTYAGNLTIVEEIVSRFSSNLDKFEVQGYSTYTKTYTSDALFKKLDDTRTYTTNANFRGSSSVFYGIDVIFGGGAVAYTADALFDAPYGITEYGSLVRELMTTYGDMVVGTTSTEYGEFIITGGEPLTQQYTKTYTSDSLFKSLSVSKTYTTDTRFKGQDITKTFTSDSRFKVVSTKTYPSDSLFKRLGDTKTFTADSLFKKLGVVLSYTCDSEFESSSTKIYTTDMIFKKINIVKTLAGDAFFKKVDEVKTYTLDVIVGANVILYTANALFKKLDDSTNYTSDTMFLLEDLSGFYTADVLFENQDNIEMYTSDTLFGGLDITEIYTLDVLIESLDDTQTYTSDTHFGESDTVVFNGDVFFLDEDVRTYTIDSIFKKLDIPETYTSDVFIKYLDDDLSYTADMLFVDVYNYISYPSDVLFRETFSTTYGADAVFVAGYSDTSGYDKNLDMFELFTSTPTTKTYTVDVTFKEQIFTSPFILEVYDKTIEGTDTPDRGITLELFDKEHSIEIREEDV